MNDKRNNHLDVIGKRILGAGISVKKSKAKTVSDEQERRPFGWSVVGEGSRGI